MQITIPNDTHFHAVIAQPASSESQDSSSVDSIDSANRTSLRKPMKTFRRNSIAVMNINTNQEEEEENSSIIDSTAPLQHARSPGGTSAENVDHPTLKLSSECTKIDSTVLQTSPKLQSANNERKTIVTHHIEKVEPAEPIHSKAQALEEPPSPMQFTSVNYFGSHSTPSNYNMYRRRASVAGSGASFSERAKMQIQLSCNDKHYLNSPNFAARRNFVGFPLPVKNASEEGESSHDVRNEKLVKHILDGCLKKSKELKDVRHEKFSPSNSVQNSTAASPSMTPRTSRMKVSPKALSPTKNLNDQFETLLLESKTDQKQ